MPAGNMRTRFWRSGAQSPNLIGLSVKTLFEAGNMVDESRSDTPGGEPGKQPESPSAETQGASGHPLQKAQGSLPRWLVPTIVVTLAVYLVIVYVNNWNLWDGRRLIEVTDDA